MRQLLPAVFAGLMAIAAVVLYVSPAVSQDSSDASLYVSRLLLGKAETTGNSSAHFRLVQGMHFNDYTPIPPKAPDYREYYGFGLPAYPPYGSAGEGKSHFPYGGRYPSYGDAYLYKYKVCPPWALYPYEC